MQPTIPILPEQASTVAPQVDHLYFFLIAVSAFFAVLVTLMVVVFAIKYRRRHDDEVGEPIHGSLGLELLWTGIPFVIAMVMFVWGASVYFAIARMPEETLDIYAVGKQWMWKFQHREGQREINELHVPVNTPVRTTGRGPVTSSASLGWEIASGGNPPASPPALCGGAVARNPSAVR